MASIVSVSQQGRGQEVCAGIKKKNTVGGPGTSNRRALEDIGNSILNLEVPDGKIIPKNRPVTRSFCAQLLSKKHDNQLKQIHESNIFPTRLPKVKRAPKKIPEKHVENGNEHLNFITFLSATNRIAGGVKKKEPELEIEDIDAGDLDNEFAVVEYVEDIYKFYRRSEEENRIEDYMQFQSSIDAKGRAVVVDWLIDVENRYKLSKPTLFLTINLLDRYLSSTCVSRSDLQLVGIGAILLASKYEELRAPKVYDFTSISWSGYTTKQILGMEKSILEKLDWTLTVPTPYVFLIRFIKACVSDQQMESMVFFLAELGMVQYATIRFSPSMFAASAVYAARRTLEKVPAWNPTLKKHTGYEPSDLMECATLLMVFHRLALGKERRLKVVYEKYSSFERHKVALMQPAKTLLAESFPSYKFFA